MTKEEASEATSKFLTYVETGMSQFGIDNVAVSCSVMLGNNMAVCASIVGPPGICLQMIEALKNHVYNQVAKSVGLAGKTEVQ